MNQEHGEQSANGTGNNGPLRVAFLGPKASFCHQAALNTFPTAKLLPVQNIPRIVSAVQCNQTDLGVIPFENSTNGIVVQTLELLADRNVHRENISVCGEAYVTVHHCLLGRLKPSSSSSSTPQHRQPSESKEQSNGTPNLSHIKTVYSHSQAWTQCTPFLSKQLPHRTRHDTESTSQAAELVSQDTSGTSAAICSILAAELYGLDILFADIEEKKGNKTRFLIIYNNSRQSSPPQILSGQSLFAGVARCKSLLAFTVPHTSPGALASALQVFGKHGIDLTSLNSRPSGQRPWHYTFFVEFEGRRGDERVDGAINELSGVVGAWKLLGSWERVDDGHIGT